MRLGRSQFATTDLLFPVAGLTLVPLTLGLRWDLGHWAAGTTLIQALTEFCFLWAAISLLLMWRGRRRLRSLGLKGTHLWRLLSGSRPSDPEELFFWRWTLQVCCAVLTMVLCVLALVFTS